MTDLEQKAGGIVLAIVQETIRACVPRAAEYDDLLSFHESLVDQQDLVERVVALANENAAEVLAHYGVPWPPPPRITELL
jgi:hypothetical protein